MTKYSKNIVRILTFFLLIAVVLVPSTVYAADGNVFTIIFNKMITTLQDVRRLVYAIAGFGLVMFAVLAIFNKISFKHLAYIMIGLSLLAVMMPFINYFSGADIQDSEYNYGNFIAGGDASITGSDISDQEPCIGEDCPGRITDVDPDDSIMGEITTGSGGLPDMPGITTDWDSNGCRWNSGTRECCDGKIKNGVCTGSTSFTFEDLLQTGKDIIDAGEGIVDAVDYGKFTIDKIQEGLQDISDIISGDGSAWEKFGALAASIRSYIDQISSGANMSLGNLGGSLENLGSAGDRISGNDNFSDSLGGIEDALDNIGDGIDDISDGIGGGAGSAQDIYGMGNDIQNMGENIGDWFDGD